MPTRRSTLPAVVAAVLCAAAALLLTGAASARAATVTVAPGDTLSAIAARSGTTVAAIAAANGLADPNRIVAGRRLTVPSSGGSASSSGASSSGGSYTVRSGDTLGAIAARAGTSVAAIAAMNGIADPNRIAAGRALRLPAAGTGGGARPVGMASIHPGGPEVGAMITQAALRHGVDPSLARAVGWQESRWSQSALSHVGAIGVMQLMPATGAEMKVGDIKKVEPNIHAGAKYMDHLMMRYFSDANCTENNRTLFAFASYNAGPGNIAKARKRAKERGLDPDQWFNNVEIVVAERIGAETTTYVRNVYKYYIAYRLIGEAHRQAEQARTQVAPADK
jgi:LysM repeat protein